MKVFELMNELSEMPAGAELRVTGCFDEGELHKATYDSFIDDEGRYNKSLEFGIETSEQATNTLVNIYIQNL